MSLVSQIEEGMQISWGKQRLIVGVSGGPDSLALLHLLAQMTSSRRLLVAHLNHGLRPSADAEAEFVRITAEKWGIPCVIEKTDVANWARDQGLSLEEAGRNKRYQFFARLAAENNISLVAVGHHADDQVESILMHILRGSGLAGLRGMLPFGPMPGAPEVTLIRPFLQVDRAEIEEYCRQNDLRPLQDASNQDTTFFRNRLRHELIPILADYNPQIKGRLQHMAAVISADYQLLDQLVDKTWTELILEENDNWLSLDRAGWLALPLGMKRSLLRKAVWRLQPSLRDVSFQTIEQARLIVEEGPTGSQATLPGGLILTVEFDRLTLAADPNTIPLEYPQMAVDTLFPLPVPGQLSLANQWEIEATNADTISLDHVLATKDPWRVYVDVKDQPLMVRPRKPGERFQPLGMEGHSARVQDVMINRKIPGRARPLWPIVASPNHLIWLVGHHIDERAKTTAESRHIVQLRCSMKSI